MPEVKRREKPGVYRTFPNQFHLRLSDEQLDAIEREAKVVSKTPSDFVRDAVMHYVNTLQEERLVRRRAQDEEEERAFVPRVPRRARGLGLSQPAPSPVTQPVQVVSAPAPTIVVHAVPPASSQARGEVDLLADYVLSARNTVDLEERRRVATKVIVSSTTSKEEQERLARALDERVKQREQEGRSPPARSGWGLLGGPRR